MILAAIIIAGLIALFCFAAVVQGDECPRSILGYNCRGEDCDHSALEIARAKEAMKRRHL